MPRLLARFNDRTTLKGNTSQSPKFVLNISNVCSLLDADDIQRADEKCIILKTTRAVHDITWNRTHDLCLPHRVQLMRGEADEKCVVLECHMAISRVAWNPGGTVLAISGVVPTTGGNEASIVQFYSYTGRTPTTLCPQVHDRMRLTGTMNGNLHPLRATGMTGLPCILFYIFIGRLV